MPIGATYQGAARRCGGQTCLWPYDDAVRRIGSLGGVCVLAAVLLGCGSSGGTSSTLRVSTPQPTTGAPAPATAVLPPKPRESISQAAKRIGATIFTNDCAAINRLTALSRPYDACKGLQAFAGIPLSATASYGNAGGVIAFGSGESLRNAILIVDADGRYHIPLVDPFTTAQSVGTSFASQFDAAAQETVKAMRERDCDAFRRVALVRFGSGAAPDQVCAFLDNSALTRFLAANPSARPWRLGGNQDYAFYAVSDRNANFTLVMARESSTDVAPGTPALPRGAPEYGFVDAYQTNPPVRPAG
jgi:hypothetical protein